MVTAPVLDAERLVAGYRTRRSRVPVVGPVTLSLRPNALTCLLGPNGSGKSTLLRTLAGMQLPLSGRVCLAGSDVHRLLPRERARCLSVVLTDRVAAGLLTAYDLVAFGRHPFTDWSGRLDPTDHAAVQQAIRAVGAEPLAGRLVSELSDGERQKVMVARALAQDPSVMVLDEITAFLDLPRRVETMQLLGRLAHDHGRAVLLSTHDLDLALRHADVLWVLAGGVVATGLPEELVLNGALEAAFSVEGLTFDRFRGTFHGRSLRRGRIRLRGEGLDTHWTRHALERAGFSVLPADDPAAAPVVVTVLGPPTGPCVWRCSANGREVDCLSLAALLDVVHAAGTA